MTRRGARVAFVGFQGFGNLGDEALLGGIEALIRASQIRVTTVFTGPDAESVSAFPRAARISTAHHLPNIAALRRLRDADCLVLAGGGLFNDHWMTVVPRYTAWVLAARLAGARVVWAGVGIGPLHQPTSRWLTRLAAAISSRVTVRDTASAALIGGTATVIPDVSLFNDPPTAVPMGDELGLIVRAPAAGDARKAAALVGALAETLPAIRAAGMQPLLLTMGGSRDDPFAAEVLRAIRQRGGADVRHERLGPTVAAALARLGTLRGVVTVRLHGMLLAALAGVPSVPIAYDDKVRRQAAMVGLDDLVVDLDDISGQAISAKLDRLLAEDRRAALRVRVEQLRGRAPEVAELLLGAITGSSSHAPGLGLQASG